MLTRLHGAVHRHPYLFRPAARSFSINFSAAAPPELPNSTGIPSKSMIISNILEVTGQLPPTHSFSSPRSLPRFRTLSVSLLPGSITRIELDFVAENEENLGSEKEINPPQSKNSRRLRKGQPSAVSAEDSLRNRESERDLLIDRVPAVILLPSRSKGEKPSSAAEFRSSTASALQHQQFPAVLCLHQTTADPLAGKLEPLGESGNSNYFYALELAQRGYITMALDYPNFGEYKPPVYELGYNSVTMKAIWNNLLAVDLLSNWPLVDSQRIAVIGHSLGATGALFQAVFDDRIAAVVASCGLSTFQDYAAHSEYYNQVNTANVNNNKGNNSNNNGIFGRLSQFFGPKLSAAAPETSTSPAQTGGHGDLRGWARRDKYLPLIATKFGNSAAKLPFDWPDVLAAIFPKKITVIAGKNDRIFPASGAQKCVNFAQKLYENEGRKEDFMALWHEKGHSFPPECREKAYEWLDKFLQPKQTSIE
jgi:pimeloyl-ACP methyl ester carboxylesterase